MSILKADYGYSKDCEILIMLGNDIKGNPYW